jgi:hypothetical protein
VTALTAYDRILSTLRDGGGRVDDRRDGRALAQCPAHDDTKASLSVTGIEGQVLMYCHAGCDTHQVLQTLGLSMVDLFDSPRGATYVYPDDRRVHRRPDKSFRQSGNTKGRSLFHVDKIASAARVFVVEGEKDVLAVEAVGGVAVSSAMGAGKAHKFDWTPLKGKNVEIVADRDEPGRNHAGHVAAILTPIAASCVVVSPMQGKDAADHIAAGYTLDDFTAADADEDEPAADEDTDRPGRKSVAARLVDMARQHYLLGVTDEGEPFGAAKAQPHIAMLLRGGRTGLRADLAARFFAETGAAAGGQALADSTLILEGIAASRPAERLYLRVAEHDAQVYIDTGRTDGQVIRIAAGKWSVTDTAPVRFQRTKLTGEMPLPPRNGDLERLWDFVNIDPEDQAVLIAVLIAALVQPDAPHPILALFAEQGSAKSSTARILVDLIDPSPVPLRQAPRDADSWVTAAAGSWVVALDNLSGIPAWLSDSLCRAVTGDGSVKRALYTDAGLAVLRFRRCMIVNGIDVGAVRPDLAERLAVADLKRITKSLRRPERQLLEEWSVALPSVLSGLLDLAAAVHQRLDTIVVADPPRMADFAHVLAAVDEFLGTEGLKRYLARADQLSEDSLSTDPFIDRLRTAAAAPMRGRSGAELLSILTPLEDHWRRPKEWPRNGRDVTTILRRHGPALRALGWQVDDDGGRNHRNVLLWTIEPPTQQPEGHEQNADEPSQPSQPSFLLVEGENEREEPASHEKRPSSRHTSAVDREAHQNPTLAPSSRQKTAATSTDEAARVASQKPASVRLPQRIPAVCPLCERAPANSSTGMCDLCGNSQRTGTGG